MAEEESQGGGSSSGNEPNKLVLAVLVLNILVVLGVGAIVFLDQKKKDAAQSIEKLAEGASQSGSGDSNGHGQDQNAAESSSANRSEVRFFNVGEFTANLNGGPGAAHYVRVSVNLQLGSGLQDEEMKKRSPQIRDKVITLLNAKTPKDLQSRDGRKFLKQEIQTSVNAFLESGQVSGVYFSTFVFE